MDTTKLRAAYSGLLEAAAHPDLGDAADGGWNVDQILAHLVSVDSSIAAVALGVISGARPTFDNRICLDPWNLERIIAAHSGRAALLDQVARQSALLCDIADHLSHDDASVQVPCLLVSNDALVVDQPIPLSALVDGLADDHVPVHTRQVLELRVPALR